MVDLFKNLGDTWELVIHNRYGLDAKTQLHMNQIKFSNIHFSSCKDSTSRLRKWGEESSRIFEVGAPQLDDIKKVAKLKKNTVKIQNCEIEISTF